MISLKTPLLILGVVVVVPVVGILGFAATRPDTFHIERSATIQAPAEKVYAQVSDFQQWTAWSPWEKMDPNMKRTFSGAASGKGAVYSWTGNQDVGKGKMEIVEAVAPSKIVVDLSFIEPFQSVSKTTWSFESAGGATKVTWAMDGRNEFMSKVFCVFMDMDKMIGKDFETGLANLKAIAEKGK